MKSCSAWRRQPEVASCAPLTKKNSQAAKKATAKSKTASYAMDASRRGRPGVLNSLLPARLRGDFLALARRERLVFGPLLAQLVAPRRRRLDDLLVGLARLSALLRRELGPGLHAPLHALLALRRHLPVALRHADPLAPALGLEAFPVRLERREDHLLLGRQLGPRGTRLGLRLRRGLGGGLFRGDLRRHVDGGLGKRRRGQEHGQAEPCRAHHCSPSCLRSQFWNPRSR